MLTTEQKKSDFKIEAGSTAMQMFSPVSLYMFICM